MIKKRLYPYKLINDAFNNFHYTTHVISTKLGHHLDYSYMSKVSIGLVEISH